MCNINTHSKMQTQITLRFCLMSLITPKIKNTSDRSFWRMWSKGNTSQLLAVNDYCCSEFNLYTFCTPQCHEKQKSQASRDNA